MKYKLLFSFLGLASIILVGNQSVQAEQTITPGTEEETTDVVCITSNIGKNDIAKPTIKKALEELTILPQNVPIKLPLLHCPVLSSLLSDNGDSRLDGNFVAIGTVNSSGQAEAITPGQEREMFGGGTLNDIRLRNGEFLGQETNTDEIIGYIDTSGKAQPLTYAFIASLLKNWNNTGVKSKNPPILIVRDSQKNLTYFLPRSVNDINLENVLLHSLINFQIRRSNHDLSKLNINNSQK
jgi:hypothetical protein